MNNETEALKYSDYPEGSLGKRFYDSVFMPFPQYLAKYYQETDLSRWNYVTSKFLEPLFNGTSEQDYDSFLDKVKPGFKPDKRKLKTFYEGIRDDDRFDVELKQFFSFLFSIDFFRELSFEEWLNVTHWTRPWDKSHEGTGKTISQIIRYNYSFNYLKERLSELSIF